MDELVQARGRIARAVALARVGRRAEPSEALLGALSGLLTGDLPAAAAIGPLNGALADLGSAVVRVEAEYLHLGPFRMPVREAAQALHTRGVRRLVLHGPLSTTAAETFVRALAGRSEGPARVFDRALLGAGAGMIELQGHDDLEAVPETALEVAQLGAWLADAHAGRVGGAAPLRRIVADLLDRDVPDVGEDADAEPALAPARRVCRLALRIGLALQLPRYDLEDLGIVALTLDVPAANPPVREDEHAERHVAAMFGVAGFGRGRVRRVLAALDQGYDLDHGPAPPSLFGRILHLAVDYDTLVHEGALAPADALRALCAHTATRYCPLVFQAMLTALGPTPPGTRLKLQDGRIVVVIAYPRSPETMAFPLTRVVAHKDGRAPTSVEHVDLAREGRVVRVLGR